MTDVSAFDVLAADYDGQFTTSLVGREQRRFTRKWLNRVLAGQKNLQILEINCGTGEDALWLAAMGHQVIATDQSPAMIAKAKQKANNAEFITCAFDELEEKFNGRQFDLVFSNFAGLNCVLPGQLRTLGNQLHRLIKPGGHFAAVIFGKFCLWETAYYLSKGRRREAFRRRAANEVQARLDDTTHQSIYYYSVKEFTENLPFTRKQSRPVGLFIPPSYLEGAMKKHPRLFRLLVKMEEGFGGLAAARSLSDHTWLLFKKEMK
jgi:ubiquinone/menaquinone biosynthesis C-methylase UbiE